MGHARKITERQRFEVAIYLEKNKERFVSTPTILQKDVVTEINETYGYKLDSQQIGRIARLAGFDWMQDICKRRRVIRRQGLNPRTKQSLAGAQRSRRLARLIGWCVQAIEDLQRELLTPEEFDRRKLADWRHNILRQLSNLPPKHQEETDEEPAVTTAD